MHEENEKTRESEKPKLEEASAEEYGETSSEDDEEREKEVNENEIDNKDEGETEGNDVEEQNSEKAKESINVDDIEQTLRKKEPQGFAKDIGILVIATTVLTVMIYFFLLLLGFPFPARTLVVPKGTTKPFFLGIQRRLIEDSFDGTIRLSKNQTISVILLYSPYSIRSKWFREEFFNTARSLRRLHGDQSPYFGATNCFDSNSYCRQKYNLKQYPVMMAQNSALMGSVYNGPMHSDYVTRWLNRLQNIVYRLQSPEDLQVLSKHHDLIVILYSQIKTPPSGYQSVANFTKLAYHFLDGDPNSERTVFCIVTDANFAEQLQLHNEHDAVIVSSDLSLLATHYKGWTSDAVYNDIVRFSNDAANRKITFLNLGRRFHSTQLAEMFEQGSVLLYFTKDLSYGNKKYNMFREIAEEYRECPEKDMISIDSTPKTYYVDDCSTSLKACFCETNSTLSFLMVDTRIENSLAAKYGAEKYDTVIAINSKQEILRYVRNNITRETIRCLIRQHHNSAEREFVTETTEIITTKTETAKNLHNDAVGKPSLVKYVDNAAELLANNKINVILFMGGIWHSSSSSAIAPFHLVANHFRESKSVIDFSMVDTSEVKLPFILNFAKLPKILVTCAKGDGSSWTYPDEFMLNHVNIVRFILTRTGKEFELLQWMNSCQGECRIRARWKMLNQRSLLERQLRRNVVNSTRQRLSIRYYDVLLRVIS